MKILSMMWYSDDDAIAIIAGMEYRARSLPMESDPNDTVLLCADAIYYLFCNIYLFIKCCHCNYHISFVELYLDYGPAFVTRKRSLHLPCHLVVALYTQLIT